MARAADDTPLWHLVMATTILALLPPVLVVIAMQRLFVKGLVEPRSDGGQGGRGRAAPRKQDLCGRHWLPVRDVSLTIPDGNLCVLVGPSGCGKSTLLRMVAGLEAITAGEVLLDGKVVNHREPAERDIAMVFQNYALYPHMSVYHNMAYGLRNRRMPAAAIRRTRARSRRACCRSPTILTANRGSFPVASASAIAMGRAWCPAEGILCSTNVCRISTPSCALHAGRDSPAAAFVRHHVDLRDP